MIIIRRLTPELRRKLKAPLGLLIQGSPEETMEKLAELIERKKPEYIISVGDVVSENMINHNIQPQVLVVDNLVMRRPIKPILMNVNRTLHVKNPPGTLTEEAWAVMQEAVQGDQRTRVLVEGEEDLLTLLAVSYAPENSLVVYGQPHEGIVTVKVTKQKKEAVREIVETMEPASRKVKVKEKRQNIKHGRKTNEN